MNDPKYIEDAISDFPDKANEQFQAYKMPLYGEDSIYIFFFFGLKML